MLTVQNLIEILCVSLSLTLPHSCYALSSLSLSKININKLKKKKSFKHGDTFIALPFKKITLAATWTKVWKAVRRLIVQARADGGLT